MLKTLRLALNHYATVPITLRTDPEVNVAAQSVSVNLASLYHHYFLDSFDTAPPNPDPTQFEHAQFLLPTAEFRFQSDGLGASPAIRRHRSNELGQAFCRWFLYEHLGITYFAHVERLLGRQALRPFPACRLDRVTSGDTPDYLCSNANQDVCLAEAKGRYSSVSFSNKEFGRWREQFTRVAFKDSHGVARRLKGHIVAARFATESDSERLRSTLFAEDPFSPGDRELDDEASRGFARIAQDTHFASVAQKLRQPVLAAALLNGVPMPEELRVSAIAWRVTVGPLAGRRFIGGYYSIAGVAASFRRSDGGMAFDRPDPLRLDLPGFTFFGIEEDVLRQVVQSARTARTARTQAPSVGPFEQAEFFYSGFSVLRDGTALAPLEFFTPEEQVAL